MLVAMVDRAAVLSSMEAEVCKVRYFTIFLDAFILNAYDTGNLRCIQSRISRGPAVKRAVPSTPYDTFCEYLQHSVSPLPATERYHP